MRRLIGLGAVTAALILPVGIAATPALAANPTGTGQPSQSCGSATARNTPGNANSAPGSAFNPDGRAGTVYAGQQPQNSRNDLSVSQYDVACFQVSQR
jgi:hypothetical protein